MKKGLNYTVYRDDNINLFIEDVLSKIIEEVLDLVQNEVQGIILYGGFGREEGGVERDNGQIRIVNDFDLMVFVKGNFVLQYAKYGRKLAQLADSLAHRLGIRLIDLSLKHVELFSANSPLTVANYELKRGNKTLFGDIDIEKLLPYYDAQHIGIEEGTTFFLKRGCGLLIAEKYLIGGGESIGHNIRDCVLEIQKAIMAIGDTMLIHAHQYHFSYLERRKRLRSLLCGNETLCPALLQLYEDAVENKTMPNFNRYINIDLKTLWFQVQKLYHEYFLHVEQLRLGKVFKTWEEYSAHIWRYDSAMSSSYLSHAGQLVLNDFSRLMHPLRLLQESSRRRRKFLLSALPLLIFAVQKVGFDESKLHMACDYFRINGEDFTDSKALWNSLVNLWLRLFSVNSNNVIKDVINL